jgi:predicted GNAT family acetyltransferase
VTIAVADQEDRSRFQVTVDGRPAGFTQYTVLIDDEWAFIHTEIEPEYEGRGLAKTLIRTALDEMRARGISVLPYCPFVRGFIAKHSEYLDLVPEQFRPRFGL